jgi:NAD(P)-dependent dehydrogenase (short-subunit alcohol dehydrogenase family)
MSGGEQAPVRDRLSASRDRRQRVYEVLSNRRVIAGFTVLPVVLLLALIIAFPILWAFVGSFFEINAFNPEWQWLGIDNYVNTLLPWSRSESLCWHSLWLSVVFAASSVAIHILVGTVFALLLNKDFRFKKAVGALVFLPFLIPTAILGFGIQFMLNANFGVVNWMLVDAGLIDSTHGWLGDPDTSMATVVLTNSWKFYSLVTIMVYARLQAIPRSHYETAEMIGDEDRTLAIETDVTDEAVVEAAIEETVDEFGGLDCLVNNAGIGGPTKNIEDVTVEEWQHVQDVNVLGTFLCTKHAAPHIRASDRGSVVAISSTSAKRPHPMRTPYTASKAAQITMLRAVAHEMGPDGVTANTVCPGPVAGDRIERVWQAAADELGVPVEEVLADMKSEMPIDEIVQPEDIGEMVAYLAGPHARHITAQAINVDSGIAVY